MDFSLYYMKKMGEEGGRPSTAPPPLSSLVRVDWSSDWPLYFPFFLQIFPSLTRLQSEREA